jgi:dipeptidase D
MELRNLEPKAVWNHFADLNAVPRPSKKEERVIAFMQDFGKKLGLPTYTDEVGNVIIKKPATKGMEDRAVIVLQSHLDMVHQKNADTVFDFYSEGIKMYVDGDWVKAQGTTLGADNGMGVATIMALLSSDNFPHPALEALFTIDEETGMTGALNLKGGFLNAKYMLNLDTEDDTELTIGCAGGIDVTVTGKYPTLSVPSGHRFYKIAIKGLTGGHSGMDIHLGRGNANKLMNRLLLNAQRTLGILIAEIDGGSLRNAIPRESFSIVAVSAEKVESFKKMLNDYHATIKAEYNTTDPNITLLFEESAEVQTVADNNFVKSLLSAVYACPNGIYRMSPDIKDLVQTSNNLARVLLKDGEYKVLCLTRSSVDSEKMDEAEAIRSLFELIGAEVSFGGSYPGWTPKPTSRLVEIMSEIYVSKFGAKPHVNACHAGLECGILGTNYPDMEMISFGPNIRGAHSPDEMVQISSVQKYWDFLLETLVRL